MNKINSNIQFRLLKGFEDPHISVEFWDKLLHNGPSDFVFLASLSFR